MPIAFVVRSVTRRAWWTAALTAALLLTSVLAPAVDNPVAAQAAQPPLPSGWPGTLQLGMADGPGGAAGLRATAPFGFRYQYLAGGVNTGGGWANWNPNGAFATYYIQDSVQNNITPVFTYYMIYQSAPGGGSESNAVATNLQNTSTMTAYFNDLKLFFQRAGAFPNNRVVLHVEPDMWGYVQQRSSNDNAATFPVQVSSTGLSELTGLPNNMAGFAQALVRLRDTYSRNVVLGYHVSIWGTGIDIQYSKPPDAEVDALATRAGNFYRSLGANFDIAFGEFSDRDAAFKQYQYGDNGASWFNAADFARHARFMGTFSRVSQKRLVLWQIPLGNTRMRAVNNTWNHYQDNRVEWLLDEPARTHLRTYIDAGVVAFLFGRGADGPTCACDANNDGVTNPAAINGNTGMSLNADDDGGFFRQKAKDYYAAGAMALSGGSQAPPPATPTPTPVATATPQPTNTPPAAPGGTGYSTAASVRPTSVARGGSAAITATVRSNASGSALVDVEVYDPAGNKVGQQAWDNQAFSAGQQRTYTLNWTVPGSAPLGGYTVKIGVFQPGWGPMVTWNNAAATFTVAASAPQPGYTSIASVSPSSVARGSNATITAAVTSGAASNVLVDVEVYDAAGRKVAQQFWGNQTFAAGQRRTFTMTWAVPGSAATGAYTVKIGVFPPNWGAPIHWNNGAAGFRVT